MNAPNQTIPAKAAKGGNHMTVSFDAGKIAKINGSHPSHLSRSEVKELQALCLSRSGQVLRHRIMTESPEVTFYIWQGVFIGDSTDQIGLGRKANVAYGDILRAEGAMIS